MLPREYRLTRSRDFVRVRRQGRSARTRVAALYVLRTRNPDIQVGFSVSKRVGKATTRNRVKRLMREAVRQHLPSLRHGQQLVFIAQPPAADASFQDVTTTVAALLERTGAEMAHNG